MSPSAAAPLLPPTTTKQATKQQQSEQPNKKTTKKSVTMLTTAKPRRSASRGRPKAQSLQGSGGSSGNLQKQGTVSKDPRAKTPVRRTGAPVSRRSTTARRSTNSSSTSTTTPRRRFQPPPPPPMYWICYDFAVKLIRGLCLGVAIGLLLTVVLPWLIDSCYLVYDTITEAEYSWPDISSYTNLSSSWNVTSSRIWRPDQESQIKTSNLRGRNKIASTPAPTLDPKVQQDEHLMKNFPRGYNRTMTVVHVGHTGGRSLMQSSPNLYCRERYPKDAKQLQACLQQHAATTPLAKQAKYYFHLGTGRVEELQISTTFLFTLRNPVDRILSIYADSHPLACVNPGMAPPRPWGCTTREYWNLPDTQQYKFYSHCFPNRDAEAMAQATKAPWVNATGEEKLVTSLEQQQSDCRWMARELVSGSRGLTPLAPHMHYNIKYYAQQTILKFGGPEVMVIRAEQETQDLALLHKLLGAGSPDPRLGASSSLPPPQFAQPLETPKVSPQAYAKLCCVLENEIEMYDIILQRSVNLPAYEKQRSMDELRQKCGLTDPKMGWDDWRIQCKNQLEIDSVLLTP